MRYLTAEVTRFLSEEAKMAFIAGPRQVGKSTLAQALIKASWDAAYLTLDDRTTLDAALRDPDGFVNGLPMPAVIDEVQNPLGGRVESWRSS